MTFDFDAAMAESWAGALERIRARGEDPDELIRRAGEKLEAPLEPLSLDREGAARLLDLMERPAQEPTPALAAAMRRLRSEG